MQDVPIYLWGSSLEVAGSGGARVNPVLEADDGKVLKEVRHELQEHSGSRGTDADEEKCHGKPS